MKHVVLILMILGISENTFAQQFSSSCTKIKGKAKDRQSFVDSTPLIITLTATSKPTLLTLLNNSTLGGKTLKDLGEEFAPSQGNNKTLDSLITNVRTDSVVVVLDLSSQRPEEDTTQLIFSCDGAKGDTIPFIRINTATASGSQEVANTSPASVIFIKQDMIRSIQDVSGCYLCETRPAVYIDKRRNRVYSTDYIVTYDPMLKNDAYTICKHIFRTKGGLFSSGKGNNIIESYKKVGSRWFAPHVGSQIRFEVVNQPLTDSKRITVDAQDLFNGGASQFQGIINSQVSAGIINRLNPSAEGAGNTDSAATNSIDGHSAGGKAPEATPAEKLEMLRNQLLDYVSVFRLSSCTIDQHEKNLPSIIANINKAFGISASGASSVVGQLKSKFADSADLKTMVNEVGNMLTLLKDLKPLAYTTLRAKNRDYMVVKTFDANNTEISNENIRLSGGMKIDFSAGFVLTGLRDFNYILKDTSLKYQRDPAQPALTDTSGNMIIQENTGKRQAGVGILTHIYPRMSSHYNLGATVGLMSSTELDLRFMLGGSFMLSSLFGSNHRVSFNGGVVWGKVKRLSNAYYEGYKVINNKPVFYPSTTPVNTVTVPVTEHSWFFAVTMNFGGN